MGWGKINAIWLKVNAISIEIVNQNKPKPQIFWKKSFQSNFKNNLKNIKKIIVWNFLKCFWKFWRKTFKQNWLYFYHVPLARKQHEPLPPLIICYLFIPQIMFFSGLQIYKTIKRAERVLGRINYPFLEKVTLSKNGLNFLIYTWLNLKFLLSDLSDTWQTSYFVKPIHVKLC